MQLPQSQATQNRRHTCVLVISSNIDHVGHHGVARKDGCRFRFILCVCGPPLVIVQVMHSGTMSNKLIGQARLTMVEIAQAGESLTRWLPLLDGR